MFAEFAAGITGIVLGILALAGVAPITLVSTAVLVFGVALILGCGLTSRLNHLELASGEETRGAERLYRPIRFVNRTATGVQLVIGLAAAIFGIMALAGFATLGLIMVSVLILGFATFLTGTAISSRIMHLLHRC